MSNLSQLEYTSEKYGNVQAFREYRKGRYEWTIYMKMPIHLYDIVTYRPAGPVTIYYGDGRVVEAYQEEAVGTDVYTYPRNMRIDEYSSEELSAEACDKFLDEFFKDVIKFDDGVLTFEKIIGEKQQ